MKKLLSLTLVCLLVLSLAAVGSAQASGEKTKVTVWHLWAESQEPTSNHMRLLAWADAFNAAHDDIEVELAGGKTADVILTTIAAGNTPDIFMNYWNNAPTWSDRGAIYDLTDFVNNDESFDKADFMEGSWALATYQDVIYSIPNTYSSTFIFYRADLLREAGWESFPTTMEDLAQCLEDLTIVEEDGTITRLGMIPDYPWLDVVLSGANYGAPFIDYETNTITFDDPRMVASYQFQADIYARHGYDEIKRFQDTLGARNSAEDAMLNGKVAMRWNSEGACASLEEFGADVEWDVAAFPPPADQADLNMGMLTGNVWQMNAKVADPDAAWTVLADLTSSATMIELAKGEYDNGNFYARASAISALRDTHPVGEKMKKIADMMLTMDLVSFPMLAYVNEYIAEVGPQMEAAFKGEITVEEACGNVVEAVQPLADEYPVN